MSQSQNFQKNVERWAQSNPKQAILLSYVDCRELIVCKTKHGEPNLKKGQWRAPLLSFDYKCRQRS